MTIWQRITGQHKKVSLSDLQREADPQDVAPQDQDPQDAAPQHAAPPDLDLQDFEQTQRWLKVRLCPADALEGSAGQDVVRQDPANGLAAVLALDLSQGARDVTFADAEAWATPIAALFAIALGNLEHEQRFERTERGLPSGGALLAFRSESVFTASQLLVVDHLLEQEAPFGALASVPKSNLLLVHPIGDVRCLVALEELALLSMRMYEAGPHALSPHLYWAEGRRLMRLPVTIHGDQVTFKAPPRFTTHVLERLADYAGA